MEAMFGSRREPLVKVDRSLIERELQDVDQFKYGRDMLYRTAVDTLQGCLDKHPKGSFKINRDRLLEAFGEERTRALTFGDS